MDLNLITQLCSFSFLTLISYLSIRKRTNHFFNNKSSANWIVDLFGLFIQGTLIPLAQVLILGSLLNLFFPHLNSSWQGGVFLPLFLNLIVVDYLYYWFHKIYHSNLLWPLHFLHHTAEQMDVFVSSRNNLWVNFILPYFWFNGLFYFLVDQKEVYILCVSITAILDLWRHSTPFNNKKSKVLNIISLLLITPYEHALHHSRTHSRVNFGANLNIWDKLHKTYQNCNHYPEDLGFLTQASLFEKIFRPYKTSDRGAL